MHYDNNAVRIRRNLLMRTARLFFEGRLEEGVDRIPLELRPRDSEASRCCIHKDRAVLKCRLMAILGYGMEDETDELDPLSHYAAMSMQRTAPQQGTVLNLFDEACSACIQARYFVTNACRGCLARPCTINCPKKAIRFNDQGQATIDTALCVNCGICMKVCPYHAVIRIPIPCEEACPTGAITKDDHNRAKIDESKCILCGKCMRECPFSAIMERSQMIDVLRVLASSRQVVALTAPAILGQFGTEAVRVIAALQRLGFDSVVEVALGAETTADQEAAEFLERMDNGERFMTTSCCPAFVNTVTKHIPALSANVSHTVSPMVNSAAMVREQLPDAAIVFVSPCPAKRGEAQRTGCVDYVVTAEELAAMLAAKGIDVGQCEEDVRLTAIAPAARGFAMSGGVTAAVVEKLKNPDLIKPERIDGLTRQSLRLLKQYAQKGISGNFLEVMTCEGGCINGPCTIENPVHAKKRIEQIMRCGQNGPVA